MQVQLVRAFYFLKSISKNTLRLDLSGNPSCGEERRTKRLGTEGINEKKRMLYRNLRTKFLAPKKLK